MPEYLIKTIYFPKDRVKTGKAARVNVSLPARPNNAGISEEFISYLNGLDSRSFRLALGDPLLEELEDRAHEQDRSLSNISVSILKQRFGAGQESAQLRIVQHTLDFGDAYLHELPLDNEDKSLGVTFGDNHRKSVFGWCPYVGGFSVTTLVTQC